MDFELAKELKEAGYPQTELGLGRFYCGLCNQEGQLDEMCCRTCDCHKKAVDKLMMADNTTWGDYLAKWERAQINVPTLTELIEACGNDFVDLERTRNRNAPEVIHWLCRKRNTVGVVKRVCGNTPEEAVARLWIALQDKTTQRAGGCLLGCFI